MPSSLTIIRQRRDRRDRARRSAEGRATRLGFGCWFIVSALTAVVILAAALAYADLTRDLPPVETLPVLLDPQNGLLRQPTRLYDRSGAHLIAVLAPEDAPRRFLAYPQIPKALIDATLVLADPGFWEHPGYLTSGWRDPDSHPTLAQKLVADLLLWDEPPAPRRALRERILAAQITARYGREQVLAWYLNSANYGNYAYGIEAAARLYFDKSAASLELSEAALLASVGQAPALNPIDAPQAAEGRRLETLQIMQTMGLIQEIPLLLTPLPSIQGEKRTGGRGIAPAFTSLALAQLSQRFDRTRLERGGLTILTTLDYDLQLQAACAVQTQLARLAGAFSAEGPAADGSPCEAARLLPTLPPGVALTNAAASALVLDPRSGQVLAAVSDTRPGQESAHLSAHPSGTLITPFIYLTGFTRGLNPASLGWDIPGGAIANLDNQYHGPVRLRIALANDYLPPALTILEQMGAENLRRIAQSFGLNLPADGASPASGAAFSPLEIAAAYGIFANQGTLAGQAISGAPLLPAAALKVTGVDNSLWLDWTTPQFTPVVSLQLAYLMNHVLSDETARWPSLGHPNPLEIGRPAGAKMGLTRDGQNAWVAGYTPQRVMVVWMGNVEGAATLPGLSADLWHECHLWHALTQYAVRDLPPESWTAPAGIVKMDVCDRSGLLPTAACPNVVSEVFISGNEPTHADTLYQTFQINRETGYLATVFTSPELVEERVYMVVPPEARRWAESAALPIPPTTYDVIQQPPVLPDVHITSPSLFADVRGKIKISGTAAGAAFAFYRLEYGQGLNPQFWTQIGSDVKAPVAESTLAEWDTSDLNGLYALRLLVVRADSRLEMVVTQVSIDNTPPQVAILYPAEGQVFSRAQDKQIAFQTQVNDAYLASVEFYVDNVLVGKVSAAPFSLLWQASAGNHTLRLVAHDRAGNEAEARVDFVVAR
ncbi:MAG: penicillin-binding protein [Chloroflexi bacterium]|nr:penicillin-binding protein [Chloroflexota bacterium]